MKGRGEAELPRVADAKVDVVERQRDGGALLDAEFPIPRRESAKGSKPALPITAASLKERMAGRKERKKKHAG